MPRSHIQPAKNKDTIVAALANKQAVVVGMDTIPRQLSRAQTFDSLSSQANIAGYRAIIEAGNYFGKRGEKHTLRCVFFACKADQCNACARVQSHH